MRLLYLLIFCFYISISNGQKITSLTLVDAITNEDISPLVEGSVVDLNIVGNMLNVRANSDGEVGSVQFRLDNVINYRTENVAPYALAGDANGSYNSWTPTMGDHNLKAVAFSEGMAQGDLLDSIIVNFSVISTSSEIDPIFPSNAGSGAVSISGELKKWHNVTLAFDGPAYNELSIEANPFLDLRLEVTFENEADTFVVPGYFAVDGNAGETSSSNGNVWKAHFTPNAEGEWKYAVAFTFGKDIAISEDEGEAILPMNGIKGTFEIASTDKTGRDNRASGRLNYVGERYLQFSETKDFFIKGGADAPENLLAYEDIDNTPNKGGRRKSYAPHADDWNIGDPSWQDGGGTELIGAINYLASKGVNVFSFLTMNIGGDDKNVFPYVSDSNFLRFDCSKLDQWEVIFSHADSLGFYLHFKTQETENDQLLDGGEVGVQRKLYYRELIARFGHHLALNWNMGEENTQTDQQRLEMAAYFHENDPYHHNVVIHTYPGQTDQIYNKLIGDQSNYTGVSIQANWSNVHSETLKWVEKSAASGKKWIVANDEQGNANTGVPPDVGYEGYEGGSPNPDDIRREVLWGNLMAGGAGVEYYFGYQLPDSDLSLQNFRSRDRSWEFINHALTFFSVTSFQQMVPMDDLVSEGWCLAIEGERYLVYLKNGGESFLNLPDDSTYQVKWYNPRTGETILGDQIQGSESSSLGLPPSEQEEDWAVIVEKQRSSATVEGSKIDLKIYPNPSDGRFYIEVDLDDNALEVSNLAGKTILFLSERMIDLTNYPDGVYFVRVEHKESGQVEVRKLVKE